MSTSKDQWQLLATAIAIASVQFEDTLDRGGKPYILHLLRVMFDVMNVTGGEDPEILQIAVLHDLLEDTEYPIDKLNALGFSSKVIFMLQQLTHEDEPYEEYIKNISCYKETTIVKMGDIRDNSNIHRLKGLREKDFERMKKYHTAYTYLKENGHE